MRLLAAVVFCQLSALISALIEPNCTVRRDKQCIGNEILRFEEGETVQEILDNLRTRFCGCVYVTGNIQINMFDRNFSRQLMADDFNMFYHLEEVSETVRFRGIPDTAEVILPNLQIIRAGALVANNFSLVIEDSVIGRFILPRLTQISRGNVLLVNTGSLCNYLTVNWPDIIDGGGTLLDGMGTCDPVSMANLLPDCRDCDSGHCWSEEYCQELTKDCSGCCEDRCYTVVNEAGTTKQCCNFQCSAGCDGPTATHCYACKNLDNNGTCVSECPPETIYDRSQFRVVPNPDFRLALGQLCVVECPSGFFEFRGACVRECPPSYITSEDGRSCEECDGPCRRECAGLSNVNGENINADNIERFRGCTIITSGAILIGIVPNFNYSQLEILSTIQEIRGPLRIDGFPETTFPYLRNLRKIDTTNATVEVSLTCGSNPQMPYAFLFLRNSMLESIDLSSLEEIRGDGLIFAFNPALCYTGNLRRYLADPDNQVQCIGSERRPPANCTTDGLVCHPQCNSTTDCWGPEDHQCDDCANYRYLNRCVQDCSAVIATLPVNSSGLFQNEVLLVCESCNQECVGGCSGGSGPQNCNSCRNFFISTGGGGMFCVSGCPVGTYLSEGTLECVPCHEGCDTATGCAGPLPYLDLGNGCLDCDRVTLNRNGTQNQCIDICPSGTYRSTLQLSDQSDSSIVGDLQLGSDVCKPCNELCERCSGEGTDLTSCQLCRFAQSQTTSACVRGCDSDMEFLQTENRVCAQCAAGCRGCTGPTARDCVECTNGFFKNLDDDELGFTCVSDCGQRQFASMAGVCTDCDPLCDQCLGLGVDNCTSCANNRFRIHLDKVGPGNETLFECFDCENLSGSKAAAACQDCGALPHPTNGKVTLDGTMLESIANYTCNPTYSIVGDFSRVCQTNGTWSGFEPSCVLDNLEAIIGTVVVVVVILLLLVMLFFVLCLLCCLRRVNGQKINLGEESSTLNFVPRFKTMTTRKQTITFQSRVSGVVEQIPQSLRIPRSHLKMSTSTIGQGEFGMVYKGLLIDWNNIPMQRVAVKALKGLFTLNDVESMVNEITKMQEFKHPHVLPLIGVCLDTGPGVSIVMPFMTNGSLLDYLRKERSNLEVKGDNKDETLAARRLLLRMCHQIALGMEYLTKQMFIHRDLAARNCMLDSDGNIKVGDFGLAEDVYTSGYYRQDKKESVKLPYKWMALESLRDSVFSEKTDVWSYGVTMWEVFCGGQTPYPAIDPMSLVQLLKNGRRLDIPNNAACSDEIFAVMARCWYEDPEERPHFSELCSIMDHLLSFVSDYVKLNMVLEDQSDVYGHTLSGNITSENTTNVETSNNCFEKARKTLQLSGISTFDNPVYGNTYIVSGDYYVNEGMGGLAEIKMMQCEVHGPLASRDSLTAHSSISDYSVTEGIGGPSKEPARDTVIEDSEYYVNEGTWTAS